MSPLLFNIMLDSVIHYALMGNRGIVWGLHVRLDDLKYAEDFDFFLTATLKLLITAVVYLVKISLADSKKPHKSSSH